MKLIHLLFLLSLVSCFGKTTKKETFGEAAQDNSVGTRSTKIFTGDITLEEGEEFSVSSLSFISQNVSSGYTFSIKNNPNFLEVDGTTGELKGTAQISGVFEKIVVTATSETEVNKSYDSKEFTVAVNGDPLREHAWHLKNNGQKAFSSLTGTPGYDLNVTDVYKMGYKGNGIRIAISDSGVEVSHDDLNDNQLTGAHRDYSIEAPYLSNPIPTNFHGTAVAGIVSAVDSNNYGSLGVAPNSKFAGFQFLESPQDTAIMIHQSQGDFDIFNYSYGDYIYEDTLSDASYLDQLRYQTTVSNKVFVKAAGNEFISIGSDGICASHNANLPYENESPHLIVVGAIHADGGKASYSNAGSNLWVVAPGGEDGESFGPGIITTDLKTCFKGISIAGTFSSNLLAYEHSLNLSCDYTATMNGTSSATPNVSGVIALMREANPNLKMRDIKHILVTTSKLIDETFDLNLNYYGKKHPSYASSSCKTKLGLENHEYEQAWVTNKAGYKFSNFYGFGMIDAKAAVDAALSYKFILGNQIELNQNFDSTSFRSTPNSSIPDNSSSGVSDTLSVNESSNLTIESIQIKVQIEHPKSGEIGVELTSPDGTKSILLNINNSLLFEDDKNLNVVLTTNAFYGENINGNWVIKIIDGRSQSTGTLKQWDLNILGH